MKPQDIEDIRNAGKKRLLKFRDETREAESSVSFLTRHDPIPRQLIFDKDVTHAEFRAYGVLASYGATPFPGIRKLGQELGGTSGAVARTDGLYLERWILKEVVVGNNNRPMGTVYVLFDRKLSVEEMIENFPEWKYSVIKLANSNAKEKQPLAKRAQKLIQEHAIVFSGSDISEPESSEPGKPEQNDPPDKVPSKKRVYINKPAAIGGLNPDYAECSQLDVENILGFELPFSISALNNPSRVISILLSEKLDESQSRVVIAEFDACASRRSVESPWGLLAKLSGIAASPEGLTLSAEGEKRLPSWR